MPKLLRRADLLPHVVGGVARLAQREGLEVGPDLRRLPQRLRPAQRILHGAANHLVGLAVGMAEAVIPLEIVAGIDHRQDDVGRGHQVLPHLTDAHCRSARSSSGRKRRW